MSDTIKGLPYVLEKLWVGCNTTEHGIPLFPLLVGNIAIMIWAISTPWLSVGKAHLAKFVTWVFLLWGCGVTGMLYLAVLFGRYAKCDGCSLLADVTDSPAATAWFSDLVVLTPMVAVWAYVTSHRWGFGESAWMYGAVAMFAGPHVGLPLIALRIFKEAERGASVDNSIMRWAEYFYIAVSVFETFLWLPQFMVFAMDAENCWTWPLALAMWNNPGNEYVTQSISIAGWYSEVWALVSTPLKWQWIWFFPFGLLGFHNIVLTVAVIWVVQTWYAFPQGDYVRAMLAAPKMNLEPAAGAATAAWIVVLAVGSFYVVLDLSPVFGATLLAAYVGIALMSPFGTFSSWAPFGKWMVSQKRRSIMFFVSTAAVFAGTLAQTDLAPPDLIMAFHKLQATPIIGTVVPAVLYLVAAYSFWNVVSWSPTVAPEDEFSYFFKTAFVAPFMFLCSPCPIPFVDSLRSTVLGSVMRPTLH